MHYENDEFPGRCCVNSTFPLSCRIALVFSLGVALVLSTSVAAAGGDAKGTLSYKSKAVTLKHAYLVKGADAVDANRTIRRLILSATDIGAKIQACETMSCADGEVTEGMTVEFDGGPRLNYWVALSGGRVQYSGTERPTALKTSADEARRLAGKLSFDQTSTGGSRVEVEFDAPLLREFKASR